MARRGSARPRARGPRQIQSSPGTRSTPVQSGHPGTFGRPAADAPRIWLACAVGHFAALSKRAEGSRRPRAEVREFCEGAMREHSPLAAADLELGVDLCTDAIQYGVESSVVSIDQDEALAYPMGLSETRFMNHPLVQGERTVEE